MSKFDGMHIIIGDPPRGAIVWCDEIRERKEVHRNVMKVLDKRYEIAYIVQLRDPKNWFVRVMRK